MNASFRTAFWAMCLGLTVPMMLFVGVELTSGSRTATKAQSDSGSPGQSSLKAQLARGAAEGDAASGRQTYAGVAPTGTRNGTRSNRPASGSTKRSAAGSNVRTARIPGSELPPARASSNTAESGDPQLAALFPEGDSRRSGVVLGPQLEADGLSGDDGERGDLLPAIRTSARPPLELIDDGTLQAGRDAMNDERLSLQLDRILLHLDRLVHAVEQRPAGNAAAAESLQRTRQMLTDLQAARNSRGSDGAPGETNPELNAGAARRETARETPVDSSQEDIEKRLQSKIYRPRYLSVRAFEALARPLITPSVGRIGVAAGASENEEDPSGEAGASHGEAVVVRDTAEVLRKVERLLAELDVPPQRILLETTILVMNAPAGETSAPDLARLNRPDGPFQIFPAALQRTPQASGSTETQLSHGAGLKQGILYGDVSAFLQAAKAGRVVRRSDSWQTTINNRQAAEYRLACGRDGVALGDQAVACNIKVRPTALRDGTVQLDLKGTPGSTANNLRDDFESFVQSLAAQFVVRERESVVLTVSAEIESSAPVDPSSIDRPAGAASIEWIIVVTPHKLPQAKPSDGGSRAKTVARPPAAPASRSRGTSRAPQDRSGRPLPQPASRPQETLPSGDKRTSQVGDSQNPWELPILENQIASRPDRSAAHRPPPSRPVYPWMTGVQNLRGAVRLTGGIVGHPVAPAASRPVELLPSPPPVEPVEVAVEVATDASEPAAAQDGEGEPQLSQVPEVEYLPEPVPLPAEVEETEIQKAAGVPEKPEGELIPELPAISLKQKVDGPAIRPGPAMQGGRKGPPVFSGNESSHRRR